MQTALHILALAAQLQDEIVGGKIIATEFYKKERAAYIIIKGKQRLALGFVYHPVRWGTYLIPASKINVTTREKPWPVFDIVGTTVSGVQQLGLDRIFLLTLQHESQTSLLAIEAIGPNGNIWHLDSEHHKLATLRKKAFNSSDVYQPSPVAGKLDPQELSLDDLRKSIETGPVVSAAAFIERNILGFNRTLAREITHRTALQELSTDRLEPAQLETLKKTIEQITTNFARPESGYLYQIKGGFEAYPFKLSSSDQQPQRFKTLSLAVMTAAESRHLAAAEDDQEKRVLDALKRATKRLERRLVNVEKDIAEAANFEDYKKLGELLQVNFDKLKKGMPGITVEDIYSDSHATVEIKLDPALTPHQNAEAYFKRFRKGREGLDTLRRRYANTREQLDQLINIRSELDTNFESASQQYHQELQSLLPREGAPAETVVRLPYREFLLSTGVTIFVGRDGSDNDRTTFEFARPYELWFHTQQCAGSHVVMKFPNKSFEPSKREIEETAAIAAFHSKARNDTLVPVIYTPRKYVRKPRKAKPGLVTVEREKSVMVEPTGPKDE